MKRKKKHIIRKIFKAAGFFLLFAVLASCHDLSVKVASIPENTPPDEQIYISGNFNNWDPGDSRYILRPGPDSVYEVELPRGIGPVEYKFTRGDWTRVEKDICGNEISNRLFQYGDAPVITDTIFSWNDLPPVDCPKVTIVIDQLPPNTPPESHLSLAGSMNGWDPSLEDFRFRFDSTTMKFLLDLPKMGEGRSVEFKVTRGSLDRVESDAMGNEISSRNLSYGMADTVYINVEGWEDLAREKSNLLTILVTKLPANTPPGDAIYITGDFNGWYPRQGSLMLEKNRQGQLYINLPKERGRFEYKFTRGGWSTVEKDRDGNEIENRVSWYNEQDTIFVKIESWRDIPPETN